MNIRHNAQILCKLFLICNKNVKRFFSFFTVIIQIDKLMAFLFIYFSYYITEIHDEVLSCGLTFQLQPFNKLNVYTGWKYNVIVSPLDKFLGLIEINVKYLLKKQWFQAQTNWEHLNNISLMFNSRTSYFLIYWEWCNLSPSFLLVFVLCKIECIDTASIIEPRRRVDNSDF